MTSNVVFPSSVASSSTATAPLARVVPSYSVDTFSEFSFFSAICMPSTTAMLPSSVFADSDAAAHRATQEQDEELFRDLFAAEVDWESTAASASGAFSYNHGRENRRPRTKAPMHATSKASPIWGASGNGRSSSFLSPSTAPLSPPLVPRLNFADLMTARPKDDTSASTVGDWNHKLGHVMEETDAREDNDDDERPESRDDVTQSYAASRPNGAASNSSSATLQQETLRFLEKLDLKALLHSPRPDVLAFFPVSTATVPQGPIDTVLSASAASAFGNDEDARIESAYEPQRQQQQRPSRPAAATKLSNGASKKDSSAVVAARLSHMATTYGTTVQPTDATRKARKHTIARLANPIVGFTSTLEALSPAQRRKRELAQSEDNWNASVSGHNNNSNAATKLTKRDVQTHRIAASTAFMLDHLANSKHVYEAATTSALQSQQSQKKSQRRSTGGSDDASRASLSARKAALRKKLQANQTTNQETAGCGNAAGVATFLTQHEDDEAALSSRVKRLLPEGPLDSNNVVSSRQPTRPATVRASKQQAPLLAANANSKRTDRVRSDDRQEKTVSVTLHRRARGDTAAKTARDAGARQQQQQQQTALLAAPRKPSNSESSSTFSGRRSFAKPATARATATASSSTTTTKDATSTGASSVPNPKCKTSGAKGSGAASLLLAPVAQSTTTTRSTVRAIATARDSGGRTKSVRRSSSNASSGSQGRMTDTTTAPSTARVARTPRKQATSSSSSNSSVGNAKPNDKCAATARSSRRSSKDATNSNAAALPSISEPKRRSNSAAFRRTRAT